MQNLNRASCQNLASLLEDKEEDSPALLAQDFSMTYGELLAQVAGAASWLAALGIKAGDRVALSLPNLPHMPILYYAVLSLGAVVVPLNPLLSAREVNFHVADSGAILLLIFSGTRAEAERSDIQAPALRVLGTEFPWTSQAGFSPAAVEESAPAVILYTSGTTGKPKGATLTHKNLLSNARTVAEVFGYRQDDVFFGGLPLFHAFGQTVSMNAVFAAGAQVALLSRFSPQAASALCQTAGVSVIAAVPSMYVAMAAYLETRDLTGLQGSIRFGISGGSPLPASSHEDFSRLLDCPIYEGYGLSETSPVVSFNQIGLGLVVGSVGRALPGVEVEIRDELGQALAAGQTGQLWVRGANVMAGYWNNPAATAEVFDGGWFATGDLARLDEQGNLYIVDRLKDMILRNGYSVYPREIEDLLYEHSDVRMAAVVAKDDVRVGEEVCAFIVPRTELSLAEQEKLVGELDALCRANLAAYKYPRQFRVVAELPLGPTGKILKRQL